MPFWGHTPVGVKQGAHFPEAGATNTLSSSSFPLMLCNSLIPLGPKWKSPPLVLRLAEMPPDFYAVSGLPADTRRASGVQGGLVPGLWSQVNQGPAGWAH